MNLETILNQLRHGELSQVFLGEVDAESGEFSEEKKTALISHISLGLTSLYKRFRIKEGRLTLALVPGEDRYLLDKQFSESNTTSREPEKYIKDVGHPFTNDLLKIERVYTDKGEELFLNVLNNPDSLHTPTYNQLIVPSHLETGTLQLYYRANHTPLEGPVLFYPPAFVPIELPDTYLEALLLFVASRVMNPVGMDSQFHQGNNYAQKYEMACQQLENQNYAVDTVVPNTRFVQKGWV